MRTGQTERLGIGLAGKKSGPVLEIRDLSVSYQVNDALSLVVGGENIFNVYPKQQDPGNTDTGGVWDAVQMGFSGAFYFARVSVKI